MFGRTQKELAAVSAGLARVDAQLAKVTEMLSGASGLAGASLAATQHLHEKWDRLGLLAGRIAADQVRRKEKIDTLADVEFQVFSQFGEDGIIEWLVSKLGLENDTFVEFGVENYAESNTRFLLLNRNWKGLVMDGSQQHMDHLRSTATYWRNDLQAHQAFVTAENIDGLLAQNGFRGPLGLLSVDIDGNDYWVLKALEGVSPDLLIVECNPIFGDKHAVTVAYDPQFERFRAHHSGLLFGASIMAIRELAESRGYVFLGTCRNGLNAFFVKDRHFPKVADRIARRIAWPAIHRDSRDEHGNLSFVRGKSRFDLIADCEVFCCRSNRMVRLGDLPDPFSEAWLREMSLPADR